MEHHETPDELCGVPAKIRTDKLSNTSPERYRCANLLRPTFCSSLSTAKNKQWVPHICDTVIIRLRIISLREPDLLMQISKMITYGPLLASNMRESRDVTNFSEQIRS